ncbi:hypothetical protein Tsubulata_012856 [Turnera subulata]|uniref:DUF4378 domain-containing protein n=1 Tax=Turnera subulata TaxID=218843 RepID=A0A9Q0GHI6_9ROSI|nr:hypothetical protein Tsubulata_012856 [Turnera subulata]
MERFQLRRNTTPTRSAPGHSSTGRLGEVTDYRDGQVYKKTNSPTSVSGGSSPQSGGSAGGDLLTSALRRRSSQAAVGTPIKKLLAEEMSREMDSKRKPPSVIARLMGLDGLPPSQPLHKPQKRSSGKNYTNQIFSAEKAERNGTSSSRRSSRKSSREEQEFKDVFEVLDASRMDRSPSYSSHRAATSKLNEAEMAFIQQKFIDAKRLSTDENLQVSKEFHDAIEELDSNKDLLLKFLQQPDSLFTKHLHDLHCALPPSHCGHTPISAAKTSHCPQNESSSAPSCKNDRETPRKSRKKAHDNSFSQPHGKHAAHNRINSSKFQLEVKPEPAVLPTRIVVLKPNVGKLQNATKTISSPHSSNDCRDHNGSSSLESQDADFCAKKKFTDDAGPSRYESSESRAIAKEITKQMRNSFSGPRKYSASGFKGYAGDESSSNMSESESANESDVANIIPSCSNRYRASPSCSSESSVSREARKRLSERWRMTHNSVDMGVVSRGSTLGEMLAVSDREVMPANPDCKMGRRAFDDKFNGTSVWVEPLGISSKDGWKNRGADNFLRSRSVPASSSLSGSPKTSMRSEALRNDRFMMPKNVMQQGREKGVKGNFNYREGSSFMNSKSRSKKPHIHRCAYSDFGESSSDNSLSLERGHGNITVNDPSDKNHTAPQTSATAITDTSFVPESMVDVVIESVSTPAPSSDRKLFTKGYSSASDPQAISSQESSIGPPGEGAACMQGPVADLESSAVCNEADQPSPVSVLETPFPDDLSSGSECFESLSADLHVGLRMQLQLLKLESEAAYEEGPMLISSDEDADDSSVGFSEDRITTDEKRQFSYMVSVLKASGINNADPDTFMATWHSPDCPINPLVFEELEKKYIDLTSWPRFERKLLFDRINLALLVIYQECSYPRPWVGTSTRIAPRWIKAAIEDGLCKVLDSEDKKAKMGSAVEKVLAGELRWLDLGDEVDVIGREIERQLTEELVQEIVAV